MAVLSKTEVLEHLCGLLDKVDKMVMREGECECGCICKDWAYGEVDEKILIFIDEAVNEKIQNNLYRKGCRK